MNCVKKEERNIIKKNEKKNCMKNTFVSKHE